MKNKRILSKMDIRIYTFIFNYIKQKHISPSIREICTGVGLYSTSSAFTHLQRMQDAGIISYQPNSPRSIILTDCDYNLIRRTDSAYPFELDGCIEVEE